MAPASNRVSAQYKISPGLAGISVNTVRETLKARLHEVMAGRRREEVARGVTLVDPQHDDITLSTGNLPVKGHASYGKSWSLTFALKLGGFILIYTDGIEPVLVLGDMFSELDETHHKRLAGMAADTEQVLTTTAVGADIPDFPPTQRSKIQGGTVEPAEESGATDS